MATENSNINAFVSWLGRWYRRFVSNFHKADKGIWIIYIGFVVVSLLEVFAASGRLVRLYGLWSTFRSHLFYLALGFVVVLVMQNFKTRTFQNFRYFMVAVWILLVCTLLWGDVLQGDARRSFKGMGISAEYAKIVVIFMLSYHLSRLTKENSQTVIRRLGLYVFITCGLILPSDSSAAIVIFVVAVIIMWYAKMPFKRLLGFVGLAILLGIAALSLGLGRGDTMTTRFKNYHPLVAPAELKLDSADYQSGRALIAVANGYIPGIPGSTKMADTFSNAYDDYIFAIIAEETGLPGMALVLFLYAALLYKSLKLAGRCEKNFPRLLLLSATTMICIQAALHVGDTVGLFPAMGQPLPLISKGGSSTLVTSALFGVILACSNAAKTPIKQKK